MKKYAKWHHTGDTEGTMSLKKQEKQWYFFYINTCRNLVQRLVYSVERNFQRKQKIDNDFRDYNKCYNQSNVTF